VNSEISDVRYQSWWDEAKEVWNSHSLRLKARIIVSENEARATAAFADFWDITYPHALAFVRRRFSDSHIAEDIVHEVYADMWEKMRKEKQIIKHPRAYLFRMLRGRLIDEYRKKSRVKNVSLDVISQSAEAGEIPWPDSLAVFPLVAEKIDANHERALVNKAFVSLPPSTKEILQLRFQSELSLAEIAEVLEIPLATAKTKLYRAIDDLTNETQKLI